MPEEFKLPNKLSIVILFAVIVGSCLRLQATEATQFWLDEVWSWRSALEIKNASEVFTAIHNDNNHYLNTLWMYVLGNQKDWWNYRMPSFIAGVIAIPLAAQIAVRQGRVQAAVAALFTAFCYLLVLYSSEARGFAGAVLFSLLCLDQLQRYFERPKPLQVVLYNLFAVGGFLSNLTFLYPSISIWGFYCLFKQKPSAGQVLKFVLSFHAIPAIVFWTLGYVDWQHWIVGGGPGMNALQAAAVAASLAVGAPVDRLGSLITLLVVLTLVGYECLMQFRERNSLWILYASALLVAPIFAFAISNPHNVYPRHFVVCAPFLMLLLADFCARIWRWQRVLAVVLVALFCFGNSVKAANFFRDGRGQYLQAMNDFSQCDDRTVGSTFDFQTSMMIAYYNQFLAPDRQLRFIPQKDWPEHPPEWIINSLWNPRRPDGTYMDLFGDFAVAPELKFPFGRYLLVKEYPFSSEVSGSNWVVYRKTKE